MFLVIAAFALVTLLREHDVLDPPDKKPPPIGAIPTVDNGADDGFEPTDGYEADSADEAHWDDFVAAHADVLDPTGSPLAGHEPPR